MFIQEQDTLIAKSPTSQTKRTKNPSQQVDLKELIDNPDKKDRINQMEAKDSLIIWAEMQGKER